MVSGSDRKILAYNRQAQVVSLTDQNGNVHGYDFDKLGRTTQDRITTLGSGVDGAVRRIASFVDDDGTTHLAGYSNLGKSAIVEVAEPKPDLKYTLVGTQGGTIPDIYR